METAYQKNFSEAERERELRKKRVEGEKRGDDFLDEDGVKNCERFKIEGYLELKGKEGRKAIAELSKIIKSGNQSFHLENIILSDKMKRDIGNTHAIINEVYQTFLSHENITQIIPQYDLEQLQNKGSSSLINVIYRLVAKYILEIFGTEKNGKIYLDDKRGDFFELVNKLISNGLEKYLDVYKTDIPLYEIMYQALEKDLQSGKHQSEIYLGRDAVFMFQGRRAELISKLRQMKPAERKRIKQEIERKGGIVFYPQYITIPSNFVPGRGYFGVKPRNLKSYLQQSNIDKEIDPVFVDVGCRGTIPEYIMHLLGYSVKEMKEKIHLLVTGYDDYRVDGVPKGVDLLSLEHRPKKEERAMGLTRDSDGQIKHFALPTHPVEQFEYELCSQAVKRHFWDKAKMKRFKV